MKLKIFLLNFYNFYKKKCFIYLMEKCEENILIEIISKFKKGKLYDSKNNKIENTIQALKFAISKIQKK